MEKRQETKVWRSDGKMRREVYDVNWFSFRTTPGGEKGGWGYM